MDIHDIVIVAAKRTPQGAFLGTLSSLTAPELGAIAHRGVIEAAGISPDLIDEVVSGCVLQAGIGQAPARQAALKAGIAESVGAITLNKMCGSGMKAVMLAHDLIKAGSANCVLASGMESMSNAPYLLSKARSGYRLGHAALKDHLFLDGLEDAYEPGLLMGVFAQRAATEYAISREAQDDYAERSMRRALQTIEEQGFHEEIAPVCLQDSKQHTTITQDESPHPAKLAKLRQLRPAFEASGTVTAGNSSSISDGAASLLIMSYGQAKQHGLRPLARICAHASHAQAPAWFTTAPIEAIEKVMKRAGWKKEDVDLFEINEAFAVVALLAIQQLHLDENKVNIHGGACALGHPIGASGARIIVTLLHALERHDKTRGIAALCIGGGEATAIAIERCL